MSRYWRLDTGLCIAVALMAAWATGYHPYSYYMLLRWSVCIMAGYLAWRLFQSEKMAFALLFGIAAVIFNPVAPIRFQRDTWAAVDLVGSALFLFGAFLTGALRGSKAVKDE